MDPGGVPRKSAHREAQERSTTLQNHKQKTRKRNHRIYRLRHNTKHRKYQPETKGKRRTKKHRRHRPRSKNAQKYTGGIDRKRTNTTRKHRRDRPQRKTTIKKLANKIIGEIDYDTKQAQERLTRIKQAHQARL